MKLTKQFKQEVEEQYSEMEKEFLYYAKSLESKESKEYAVEALKFIQETFNNNIQKAIEEIKNVK